MSRVIDLVVCFYFRSRLYEKRGNGTSTQAVPISLQSAVCGCAIKQLNLNVLINGGSRCAALTVAGARPVFSVTTRDALLPCTHFARYMRSEFASK